MGLFDRWTSKKGKAAKSAPSKSERQAEAKRQAFASVPSGQPAPTPAAKTNTPTPAATGSKNTDRAYRTLLNPIVTEKSGRVAGQYTFAVDRRATKLDVRNAVQQVYGVRPVAVNILNQLGQAVRYGRFSGQTMARRKAIVTLPAGKTIDVNA